MSDFARIIQLAGLSKVSVPKILKESNNFLLELDTLFEGINDYELMFQMITTKDGKENVQHEIDYAKRFFKRKDRIVWYLRWYRIGFLKNYIIWLPTNTDVNSTQEVLAKIIRDMCSKTGMDERQVREGGESVLKGPWKASMNHLLSLEANVPEIKNYIFSYQYPNKIITDLTELEKEFAENSPRHLKPTDEDYDESVKLISFDDGFAWWNLNIQMCNKEGNAMGHCGNTGTPKDGDRVLSLRQRVQRGSKFVDIPCLTFILDKNDYLGEMKGRGNEKPAAKYHPYIISLLLSDYVDGIKGGGYLRKNNFSLDDLSEEQKEEIIKKKPALSGEKSFDMIIETLEDKGVGGRYGIFRKDGDNLIVWENDIDSLSDGSVLPAALGLREIIIESADDIDISDVLDYFREDELLTLAKFLNITDSFRDRYRFYRVIERELSASPKGEQFMKDIISSLGPGITVDEISDFIKNNIHYMISMEYSEICQPSLNVPDNIFEDNFTITITIDEAESLAQDIDDNGDEWYSFSNSWMRDDDSDEYFMQQFHDYKSDRDYSIFKTDLDYKIAKLIINHSKSKKSMEITSENIADKIISAIHSGSINKWEPRPGPDQMDDLFK